MELQQGSDTSPVTRSSATTATEGKPARLSSSHTDFPEAMSLRWHREHGKFSQSSPKIPASKTQLMGLVLQSQVGTF